MSTSFIFVRDCVGAPPPSFYHAFPFVIADTLFPLCALFFAQEDHLGDCKGVP